MNRSSRLIRTIYAFLVAMVLTFATSSVIVEPATAKPREISEFDKLVKAGAKAYDNGDLDLAETSFRQAYAITPDASLLYNIGRVCEDRADYNCAIDSYKKYIGSSGADSEAKEDALERIATCNKYLSILGTPAQHAAPAPAPANYAAPAPAAANPGNCIDINTATASQLETIKGLGPAKSKAIIDYRNAHRFTNLNQLKEVKGIGDSTFQKFQPFLCPIAAAPTPAVAPAPAVAAAPNTPPKKANQPKAPLKASNTASSIDI